MTINELLPILILLFVVFILVYALQNCESYDRKRFKCEY